MKTSKNRQKLSKIQNLSPILSTRTTRLDFSILGYFHGFSNNVLGKLYRNHENKHINWAQRAKIEIKQKKYQKLDKKRFKSLGEKSIRHFLRLLEILYFSEVDHQLLVGLFP